MHAAAIAGMPGSALLSSVCSRSLEGARRVAEEFRAAAFTTRFEDIIEDTSIDIVDLCVPHHLHAPMAIAAARAGKHVLVEKPIATTLAEADAMIAAAREAGVKLMVAHNQRFYGNHVKAKALIDAGAIGRPFLAVASVHVHGQIGGYRSLLAEAGGGALIDSGAHRFDLLRWIMGEVESVSAETGRMLQEQMEGEDCAVVSLRFRSGAIGSFSCSWSAKAPVPEESLQVFGTKGALVAETKSRSLLLRSESPPPGLEDVREFVFQDNHAESVRCAIEAFLDCVRGDLPPPVSGEDGRAALALTLASYRSQAEGIKVQP